MRKYLAILLLGLGVFSACTKNDAGGDTVDRALVEKLVTRMNNDISSLRQLLDKAMDGVRYVSSDVFFDEDGTEVGEALSFYKSSELVFMNATVLGADDISMPGVGLREVDGTYCWTVNDGLLRIGGEAVKAWPEGKDIEFRYEKSSWQVSADGEAWTKVPAVEGFHPSDLVTFAEDDETMTFTVAGGLSFSMVKKILLAFVPESSNVLVFPGHSKTLSYRINSDQPENSLSATAAEGWSVSFSPTDNHAGSFTISAGSSAAAEGDIAISLSNSLEDTTFVLKAVLGVFSIQDSLVFDTYHQGEASVNFATNDSYTTSVEGLSQNDEWLSYTISEAAEGGSVLKIVTLSNMTYEDRICSVVFVGSDGFEIGRIGIRQPGRDPSDVDKENGSGEDMVIVPLT